MCDLIVFSRVYTSIMCESINQAEVVWELWNCFKSRVWSEESALTWFKTIDL